jgi:hypothetical protein
VEQVSIFLSDSTRLACLLDIFTTVTGGFMRQFSILSVCLTALTVPVSAWVDVSFQFGGMLGYYTLPSEVSGYIDGYASSDNRILMSESSADYVSDATGTEYRYSHPIANRTRPNIGFDLGLSFMFPNRLGFFINGSRSFSIFENKAAQTQSDSLASDSYATIPYDYKIRSITSNDQLYLKSIHFGFGLQYRIPLGKRLDLVASAAFGRSAYSQYFRTNTVETSTVYKQNNGNTVYTEANKNGAFETFGIRYSAYSLRPAIAAELSFNTPLSLRAGVACPLSYIEKGYRFTDNELESLDQVYYPEARFVAGNLMLTIGFAWHFGKGVTV